MSKSNTAISTIESEEIECVYLNSHLACYDFNQNNIVTF